MRLLLQDMHPRRHAPFAPSRPNCLRVEPMLRTWSSRAPPQKRRRAVHREWRTLDLAHQAGGYAWGSHDHRPEAPALDVLVLRVPANVPWHEQPEDPGVPEMEASPPNWYRLRGVLPALPRESRFLALDYFPVGQHVETGFRALIEAKCATPHRQLGTIVQIVGRRIVIQLGWVRVTV